MRRRRTSLTRFPAWREPNEPACGLAVSFGGEIDLLGKQRGSVAGNLCKEFFRADCNFPPDGVY